MLIRECMTRLLRLSIGSPTPNVQCRHALADVEHWTLDFAFPGGLQAAAAWVLLKGARARNVVPITAHRKAIVF